MDLLVSIIEHKKAKNKEYIYCMPILQGNCILSLMSPSYSWTMQIVLFSSFVFLFVLLYLVPDFEDSCLICDYFVIYLSIPFSYWIVWLFVRPMH